MGIFFSSLPPTQRQSTRIRLAIEALEARVVLSQLSGMDMPLSGPRAALVTIGALQPSSNQRAADAPSNRSLTSPVDPDEAAVAGAASAAKAVSSDAEHGRDDDRSAKGRVSGQDGADAKLLVVRPEQPGPAPIGGDTEVRRLGTNSAVSSPYLFLAGDEPLPVTNLAAAIAPPRDHGDNPPDALADDTNAALTVVGFPAVSTVSDTESPAAAEPRWPGGITAMLPVDTAALEAGVRRLLDEMAHTTQELLSDPRPTNFTLWVCMAGIGVVTAELVRRQMTCCAADAMPRDLEAGRPSGLRYRPVGSKP